MQRSPSRCRASSGEGFHGGSLEASYSIMASSACPRSYLGCPPSWHTGTSPASRMALLIVLLSFRCSSASAFTLAVSCARFTPGAGFFVFIKSTGLLWRRCSWFKNLALAVPCACLRPLGVPPFLEPPCPPGVGVPAPCPASRREEGNKFESFPHFSLFFFWMK